MNPYLAALLTFIVAIAFLRLMHLFAHRGWIESKMSRKFMYIGIGPLFVVTWLILPFFSSPYLKKQSLPLEQGHSNA